MTALDNSFVDDDENFFGRYELLKEIASISDAQIDRISQCQVLNKPHIIESFSYLHRNLKRNALQIVAYLPEVSTHAARVMKVYSARDKTFKIRLASTLDSDVIVEVVECAESNESVALYLEGLLRLSMSSRWQKLHHFEIQPRKRFRLILQHFKGPTVHEFIRKSGKLNLHSALGKLWIKETIMAVSESQNSGLSVKIGLENLFVESEGVELVAAYAEFSLSVESCMSSVQVLFSSMISEPIDVWPVQLREASSLQDLVSCPFLTNINIEEATSEYRAGIAS